MNFAITSQNESMFTLESGNTVESLSINYNDKLYIACYKLSKNIYLQDMAIQDLLCIAKALEQLQKQPARKLWHALTMRQLKHELSTLKCIAIGDQSHAMHTLNNQDSVELTNGIAIETFNGFYNISIDYNRQFSDKFAANYRIVNGWLTSLGYTEIYSNHPSQEIREFHWSNNDIRIIVLFDKQVLCKAVKYITDGFSNYEISTQQFAPLTPSFDTIINDLRLLYSKL
jgi:hypothetical protein